MSEELSQRRPKTLHLLVRERGGGTETNVQRLCAHTPHFKCLPLETIAGFPIRASKIPALVRAVRAEAADVIFCYGITTHLIAFLAYPFRGPALVGNIRCVTDFSGVKRFLLSLIRWRFSYWISNSKAALHDEKSGYVIYNGIPNPPADEIALLPDKPRPVLGLVARDHPKKGHRFFLDLWKKLGKPGTLVFAGELGDELRTEAEREGVVCTGFVQNIGPLMRSLDLLIIPSSAEGIPTVALEAMARGVPVLAAPAGGTGELVQHGKTGYLLPREEWEAFLRTINWQETAQTGLRARDHVRKYFSFSKMQREFEFVAVEVTRNRPARRT